MLHDTQEQTRRRHRRRKGIGFAIAELAAATADVVVASSSEANVNAAVGRLPNLTGLQVDLRDEAGVAAFFERLGPRSPGDHVGRLGGRCTRRCANSILIKRVTD